MLSHKRYLEIERFFMVGGEGGFYRADYKECQTGITFISRLFTSDLHVFIHVHKSLKMLLWKAVETCVKKKH